MKRGKDKMAGLGCRHGYLHRLIIPHLSQKDDIRTLTKRCPKRSNVTLSIYIDFPLANDAFIVPVKVFQRVFKRDDMLVVTLINMINNTGKSGGLSAAGRTGNKNHPL